MNWRKILSLHNIHTYMALFIMIGALLFFIFDRQLSYRVIQLAALGAFSMGLLKDAKKYD